MDRFVNTPTCNTVCSWYSPECSTSHVLRSRKILSNSWEDSPGCTGKLRPVQSVQLPTPDFTQTLQNLFPQDSQPFFSSWRSEPEPKASLPLKAVKENTTFLLLQETLLAFFTFFPCSFFHVKVDVTLVTYKEICDLTWHGFIYSNFIDFPLELLVTCEAIRMMGPRVNSTGGSMCDCYYSMHNPPIVWLFLNYPYLYLWCWSLSVPYESTTGIIH